METNSDKERIEKEAESFSQTATNGSRMQYEINAHKRGFIAGAEYERTIANQQLAEKDKEIEHHAGIAYGMQQTIYKQLAEIASLKEALRKIYETAYPSSMKEEIEQLLK